MVRILVGVLLIIVILVVGFFLLLIFLFQGEAQFYNPLILATILLLIVWVIVWTFRWLKTKTLAYALLVIVLLGVVASCTYELRRDYIRNIPTIGDQGVDLSQYKPFATETKAVWLTEQSTLTLTDNLPRIDGATALYPLYAAFVQATYPKGVYDKQISGGTTPTAYERLIEGDVDVIFCAAPSKQQLQDATDKGITFVMTPIGREAFVFFVNKKNPIRNLTSAQIQGIYSGKLTNWKQVGGDNDEIKAFQRPEGSGSQTMLEKIMGDKPLMAPLRNNRVAGMGGIIEETADYKNFKNAIGYTFLFFATEMVKNNQIELLKIDGVYPNRSSIENGTYSFTGDFYAITTGKQHKNVDVLIEWICSPQGQYLVEETGYTPLKKE